MKIKFYSDPGHGWGAVKRKVLFDLGIADKISLYSYQKGDTVYLEEDCDLAELVRALKLKGVPVEWDERSTNKYSPIRNYARFMA
jgi:hypothetical protein